MAGHVRAEEEEEVRADLDRSLLRRAHDALISTQNCGGALNIVRDDEPDPFRVSVKG